MTKLRENRAFGEMFQAAKGMLAGKDPVQMARKAGVSFDGTAFRIPSMEKMLTFSYPEYMCTTPMHDWHYLTVLHYLNLADGSPVTGEPVAMADMPDGVVRGTKYDRTAAQALATFLQGKTEEEVLSVLQSLGGEVIPGKAALSVRLPYLPRFPLYLNIWFADEEFPPSARLLVDKSAGHYLTIEDAVSIGDVVMELLRLKENFLLPGQDRRRHL